ncbi:MAG: septum formation protein Maf [Steroidobacteraceae bacterium]|nr:septum formation protein Maf [Steroidobacteraceae bacterium]
MKSPPRLLLASTSPYRRALLERLSLPFESRAPGLDETAQAGEAPARLAARLALGKAQRIAAGDADACVIGSDQVAVLADADGIERVLGKPGTAGRCIEQLAACSGRSVTFLTAVAVLRAGDGTRIEFLDTTRVRFRRLDAATIERYVAAEAPFDCAGGFKCEGLGIALFESIDSTDPTALIGLPLIRLAAALRECGFQLP